MLQYPDRFGTSLGESVFAMPAQLTDYAIACLEGRRVPRLVMVPGYSISSKMILDVYSVRDKTGIVNDQTKTAWQLTLDYDLPGYADALNTILSANGLNPAWVPKI
jgi:hypothetical protein